MTIQKLTGSEHGGGKAGKFSTRASHSSTYKNLANPSMLKKNGSRYFSDNGFQSDCPPVFYCSNLDCLTLVI